LSRFDQFRARGHQTHARATPHANSAQPGRRQQAKAARIQFIPRLAQRAASPHVFTLEPDIFPGLDRGRETDAGRLSVVWQRLFLHHHRIGAGGQRRSGKDADAFSFSDFPGEHFPGRHPAAKPQGNTGTFACRPQIRGAHGIAIHGGIVETRQVNRGSDVFHKNSPMCPGQINGFDLRRGDLGEDAINRRFELKHVVNVESGTRNVEHVSSGPDAIPRSTARRLATRLAREKRITR
jgi:hypothetical protein